MTEQTPDVVVLRNNSHGSTAEGYAAALRERLPDRTVRMATTPHEERESVAEAPVVTGAGIDEDLLSHARELRLFACVFAGHGHLPMEALAERGVAVTTGSGFHGPSVAEWIVGNLLVFTRRLHEAWRRGRRREWRNFGGTELAGSTVAVVGQGAIGTTVVERLAAFDVDTLAVRHTPGKGGPADEVVGYDPDDVHSVLARADAVVLVCPLTGTTEGLIDAEAFETLRPDAFLLNTSRGRVVDTDALVSALRTNSIAGAALDVTDPEPLPPDHPLWTFENVLVTPHNAGGSPNLYDRAADLVAGNVERALETGVYRDLENQVLAPD